MSEGQAADTSIPKRDFILLPLVALLTAAVFLGLGEIAGGLIFEERGAFNCEASGKEGSGQKPNCVAYWKNREGSMVEYRFNECGYRSTKPCGPKPAGTLRLVLMGTSITLGLHVANDETFGMRTERELNRLCSQPVEVQNMGSMATLNSQPDRIEEALRLSPDAVVLTVVPYDLEIQAKAEQARDGGARQEGAEGEGGLGEAFNAAVRRVELRLRESKAIFSVAHFMLQDGQILYRNYSSVGNSREVMSLPVPPAGQRRFAAFAAVVERMKAQMGESGVPLLVMAIPNRISAAIASNGVHIEGTDPGWFGRHIGEIAVARGALALDTTPEFAAAPHAERFFYPVDNHPMGRANELVARALVRRLTDGSVPGWKACQVEQRASR